LEILTRIAGESVVSQVHGNLDVILDGLIGYSLSGTPSGRAAELITWANQNAAPTVALDVPPGFDAATGDIYEPAIRAFATLTIALPKRGMQSDAVKSHIGELYCADISVPPELYKWLTPPLDVDPFFAQNDIVRVGTALV